MGNAIRVIDRVAELADWDQASFTDGQFPRWDATLGKFIGSTPAGFMTPVGETPAGDIDGSNATFALTYMPVPNTPVLLFTNGLLQTSSSYVLTDNTFIFDSDAVPQIGDQLSVFYWTA